MSPGSMFKAPSTTTTTPVTAAGSDDGPGPLWQRMEQIIANDQEKTHFIHELVTRYEYLSQQYQQECEARQRGNVAILQWQRDKAQYEEHLNSLRICLERDPFVTVLIDGDGMIFEDNLIQAGEAGGRKAANLVYSAIQHWVQHEAPAIPIESKVVCRVYANVQGLSDVLFRTGVVEDVGVVEQFARGFTRGKTLFDFVDVGPGKDRADEKINETFKLYLADFHCRQIFFGCSHDNGYARTLEDNATDEVYLQRVTLLEGVPFEKELLALPFNTKKFPGIFRETKLTVWGAPPTITPASNGVAKNYNIINGLPSRFPPPPARNGFDSPIQAHVTPNLPRTSSNSTLASNEGRPMNWAAKAAAAQPVSNSSSPVYKPTNRDEVIARNRAGQRVDPSSRDYDRAEVDRIKKLKMCNVHFLRQECPYAINCTHVHSYKPTPDEINTLRLVARMAPCTHGSGCMDIKCIYGHRCPAPSSKHPVKGTKSCIFGDQCKFPPELHDIDCNVVKTLLSNCIEDLIGLQL